MLGISTVLLLGLGSCQEIGRRTFRSDQEGAHSTARLLSASHYNFGQVTTGTLVSHVIIIKNVGEGDLRLDDVSADSAIVSKWKGISVPADSTAKIEISYDTRGKLGDQDEDILIHTSASDDPIKVQIKGFVVLFPMR